MVLFSTLGQAKGKVVLRAAELSRGNVVGVATPGSLSLESGGRDERIRIV